MSDLTLKNTIQYIGGAVVISAFPVFVAMIWGDFNFWFRVFSTQIVTILFLMIWDSSINGEKDE